MKIKNMTYSKTYLGVLVVALAGLAKSLGLEIGSEAITTTVLTMAQFVGGLLVLFERYKKGGVNILGVKK